MICVLFFVRCSSFFFLLMMEESMLLRNLLFLRCLIESFDVRALFSLYLMVLGGNFV